jgi:type IV pilus assembly protein PilE
MNIRRQRGVTLIELIVAMVVVAVLATIAIPTYRQQIIRTNRSNAKTALVQTAQNLERCFTRTNSYAGCVALPFNTPDGTYRIEATAVPDAVNMFALRAVPLGTQATNDPKCANFTLNQANTRGVTGTYAATPQQCWGR